MVNSPLIKMLIVQAFLFMNKNCPYLEGSLHPITRNKTRRPGSLKIIADKIAANVNHRAIEKQARHSDRHHRLRRKIIFINRTKGHFRTVKPVCSSRKNLSAIHHCPKRTSDASSKLASLPDSLNAAMS